MYWYVCEKMGVETSHIKLQRRNRFKWKIEQMGYSWDNHKTFRCQTTAGYIALAATV